MKRILALILAVLMCISMVACSSAEEGKAPEEEKTNEVSVNEGSAEEKVSEEKKEEPKKEDKAKPYALGEVISQSFVSFQLDSVEKQGEKYEFIYKKGNSTTYYPSIDAPAGMDLLCFKGKMTNLAPVTASTYGTVHGKIKIGNFEYEMKLAFVGTSGTENLFELVGGMESGVYFYAEVPEAVLAQAQEAELSFGFVEGLDNKKHISQLEELDYLYKTTVSVAGL